MAKEKSSETIGSAVKYCRLHKQNNQNKTKQETDGLTHQRKDPHLEQQQHTEYPPQLGKPLIVMNNFKDTIIESITANKACK